MNLFITLFVMRVSWVYEYVQLLKLYTLIVSSYVYVYQLYLSKAIIKTDLEYGEQMGQVAKVKVPRDAQ